MVEGLRSLREYLTLIEAEEWAVSRTPIFDESLKRNTKIFPDLPQKLAKFIEVKKQNPFQNRYGKHDRPFTGPLIGFFHAHLRDDAILIYKLQNKSIVLVYICSHAEIEGNRHKQTIKMLEPYNPRRS